MIFQEPMSSLSPVHTVGDQIMRGAAPPSRHDARRQARARCIELLRQVEIPKPERAVDRYTFEFSGGMRQRVMIAMSLACNPSMLIADEPTTALDVTTQAEILDLIKRLQQQHGMAVMFITHDMGVVAEIADDVLVMYHGKVMEYGPVDRSSTRRRTTTREMLIGSVLKLEEKAEIRLKRPPLADETSRRVIEVRNLEMHLRLAQGSAEGRRRRVAEGAAGRDARHRRRVRLGQDHDGPLPAARLRPERRRDRLPPRRRQRRRPREGRQGDAEAVPPRDPHDLPGSGRLAQPAHDRGADHRRAAARQRHRQGQRARRPRRGPAASRSGWSPPGASAIRTPSPAASASASASPAPSRSTRA